MLFIYYLFVDFFRIEKTCLFEHVFSILLILCSTVLFPMLKVSYLIVEFDRLGDYLVYSSLLNDSLPICIVF